MPSFSGFAPRFPKIEFISSEFSGPQSSEFSAAMPRQARARACTNGGAGARQNIARACGGGSEHTSGGAWPSTRPPTKQHKRLVHARAAGADGQPVHCRLATLCAPAHTRSAGHGRGLAALPLPSQCRPASRHIVGTTRTVQQRGPVQKLWYCAQGLRAAVFEARLARAVWGVQRAQ